MRSIFSDLRFKLLAAGIAVFLWAAAHGSSNEQRSLDVPVVFQNRPEALVLTDKSVDSINLRVEGRRAVLRNLGASNLEYRVDVSEVNPGDAIFEVDAGSVDLPRGVRPVARSPSLIRATFERRGRKTVRVRADLEGEPAEGYELVSVDVVPQSVRIAGARSEVERLSEVVTEPIDLRGATGPVERQVRLLVGARNVWVDDEMAPVTVRVRIQPTPPETAGAEAEDDPA